MCNLVNWKKETVRFASNGKLTHDVYWASSEQGFNVECLDCGDGISGVLSNQELVHWGLAFSKVGSKEPQLFEPDYHQKLMVIKEIGRWKQCALEVMPPECEVVDRQDVYHLWEFEYPYSFIYSIRPIYDIPETFELECDGVKYHIAQVGKVRYLYLELDKGRKLGWRHKQNLKNMIFGSWSTAVEVIIDDMEDKPYVCLICLPHNEFLDFGLN